MSCILAKLYGSVIEARLSRYLEGKQLRAWSQAGGRPKMGVLQHQFALQHFKDFYRAPISKGGKGAPLFVCLIDFEKAFDKVDRKLIWLRLEERGINGKCLEAIKVLTTAAPPRVQVGPNRVEIQGHFKYLGSITQGNGGQDREIQPARCSGPSKSQFSLPTTWT